MSRQINTTKLNKVIDKSGMKKQYIASCLGIASPRLSEKLHGRTYMYPDELIQVLQICGWTNEQLESESLVEWYPDRYPIDTFAEPA